ncbi:N-acetylmuramoyl-L-alanine amidase, partial [Christensenella tenuis]
MKKRPSLYVLTSIFLAIAVLISSYCVVPASSAQAASSDKVIVIDPGHGMDDPGAAGINGTLEVDVNAQLAYKTAKELKNRGYTVYLTHRVDKWVSGATDIPVLLNYDKAKYDYTELAEASASVSPDLHISIHHNSYDDSSANGKEVYYTSNQNAAFLSRSKDLATMVNSAIDSLGIYRNRGVKDFVGSTGRDGPIKYVNAPAVVVETAFLTSTKDYPNIVSASVQTKVAGKIADAADQFLIKYPEKVQWDSEAPEIGSISIDNGSDIAYNSTVYKNNFTIRLSGVKDNVGVKYVEFNIWRLDGKKHWTYRAVQENATTWAQWCYVDGPGQYNIDAIAVDYNGNESERIYKTISMVEDTTAPAVGAVEFESSGQYVTETYQTQFTARVWNVKDAVGELDRVQFTVKDESGKTTGTFSAIKENATTWAQYISVPGTGKYSVEAVATDKAGNKSNTSSGTITVKKDTGAPTIGSIGFESDGKTVAEVYQNKFTVRAWNVQDKENEVKSVQFVAKDEAGKTVGTFSAIKENATTWAQYIAVPGTGTYTLEAVATDEHGNASDPAKAVITVKNDPSSLTIGAVEFESSGQYVTETYQTQFTARVWNVKDAVGELDRVQFTVKDESGKTTGTFSAIKENATTWAQYISVPGTGKYSVEAVATDKAGNKSNTSSGTITVKKDTGAPTIGSIGFESEGKSVTKVYQNNFTVRAFSVADAETSVESVEINIWRMDGKRHWNAKA